MKYQRKNHSTLDIILITFALMFLTIGCERTLRNSVALEEPTIVTIEPKEYSSALRNPLKGFRARRGVFDHEWATLWHSYIRWNEIENDESDGIDKIKTFCDQYWKDAEKHNIKVIPRVYLDWDEKEGNEYWPADMRTGDYSSEQFRQRVVRLVGRLGELWDNDPRVAFIEMGIIGYWGEHHHPYFSEISGMEELLGLAFTQAFKNKLVMVRHPSEFRQYEFGIHNDSWSCQTHGQWKYSLGMAELGDYWKTVPVGGEIAYGWREELPPGLEPNVTLTNSVNREYLIYTINWLHCTELGWVADYDQNNPDVRTGAQEVQKAFGYRYILDKVCYPAKIYPDEVFTVSFVVRNIGSAPFYYKWPVEVSLLNPETRIPVWKDTFKDIDVRQWLPGDKWNKITQSYDLKPKDYQVEGTFQLPKTVQSGEYIIALAILDPSGMVPSVRFATENYFDGGRHPIGLVGVKKKVHNPILDPVTFDNPAEDTTLKYELDNQDNLSDLSEPVLSLQEAAAIGDVSLVRSLLEKGIGVDSRDNLTKKTALQYAVISGHKDIVKLLLDKGADVNTKDKNGQTPLDIILNQNQRQISQNQSHADIMVMLLANGAEILSIHTASKIGNSEKVKAFLEKGIDVNTKDDNGQTSLHIAVISDNQEIVELLIDEGVDVNAKDENGMTPLLLAISEGHLDLAEFLIKSGADVNTADGSGFVPLVYAMWNDGPNVVKMLLNNGADVNAQDTATGYSVLHWAILMDNKELTELVLAAGADLNGKSSTGETPLDIAAYGVSPAIGELLLEKGAEISSLRAAAFVGDLAKVQTFIQEGVDVNQKSGMIEGTALHAAAASGYKEIVEFLISKGADVNTQNRGGLTPLNLAQSADHTEIVELLKQHGAKE